MYADTPKSRSDRRRQLRERYGITPEEWDELYSAQDGKCAICDERADPLVVDHDHETLKVRGLLCHRCNLTLGKLCDRADLATAVAVYLISHESIGTTHGW